MSAILNHPLTSTPEIVSSTLALETQQQTAVCYESGVQNLPPHNIDNEVAHRFSSASPEQTYYGTLYHEKVVFRDGTVRSLTRGVPNPASINGEKSDQLGVINDDALFMGPNVITVATMNALMRRGFHVEWLHHPSGGEPLPKSPLKVYEYLRRMACKNLINSAQQQHELLDDISPNTAYDATQMSDIGISRASVTGNLVAAYAPSYNRTIVWSDLTDEPFIKKPGIKDSLKLLASPVTESMAMLPLLSELALHGYDDQPLPLDRLLTIFDCRPGNVMNELSWVLPLVVCEAGKFIDALPIDQQGARTAMSGDPWSGGSNAWEKRYEALPGITFITADLPDGHKAHHSDAFRWVFQKAQFDRLSRFREQAVTSGTPSLSDEQYRYVIDGAHQPNASQIYELTELG
jgi:hypothetical protein